MKAWTDCVHRRNDNDYVAFIRKAEPIRPLESVLKTVIPTGRVRRIVTPMNEFQQLRQQLLQRLVSGEVTREEYKWALAEVERHQSEIDTASVGPQQDTSTVSAAAEPIRPGMVLGSHTVIRMLGKGGMGEVWLTSEVVHDSNFYSVVKLLAAMQDDNAKKVLAVFHKVRLLQHEHICPVYSLGHDDRVGYYFVMKYVEGETLAKRTADQSRPLSRSYLMKILTAVARGLDYAHQRNIIHRDVKPSNIMLNEDLDEIQVVDFGLAAHVRKIGETINGTPKYMAPEQWTGKTQDARTDQFSLGVVAYELLAGRVPFADSELIGRSVGKIPFPDIPDMSLNVNSILSRSMAESRDDRFENCTQFVEQLGHALIDGER